MTHSTDAQPTQPAKGEPVEIRVPTRREFFGNLTKVAPPAEQPAEQVADDDDEREG